MMFRIFVLLLFCTNLSVAETPLAKGKMLVATEMIQGEVFSKTVIILLHYDRSGAMGLVVNRPTEVPIDEVLADDAELSALTGNLYWGGPVQMNALRGMLKTDNPPSDAEKIVGNVYLVSLDADLADELADSSELRAFLGYAGWSPGQLDRELATGSWLVVDASEDRVFPKEPARLWQRLAPSNEYRAANQPWSGLAQDRNHFAVVQ